MDEHSSSEFVTLESFITPHVCVLLLYICLQGEFPHRDNKDEFKLRGSECRETRVGIWRLVKAPEEFPL